MGFLSARRVKVLLVALVLGGASFAIVPSPAFATTCRYSSCDGKDPQASGCYADARTLYGPYTIEGYDANRVWRGIGRIEMRYSPYCGTIWARVTNVSRPGWQATRVFRDSDLREYSGANGGNCPIFCRDNVGSNVSSYGYMLYRGNSHMAVEGYLCADSTCTEGTGTYSLIIGTNPN